MDPSTDASDEEWTRSVLRGTGDGPHRPFLCRPTLEQAELLVPLRPRRAASGAMRRYHDDRSWMQRSVVLLGQLLGRTGALDHAPGERRHLPPFRLVEELAAVLGETELIPAVGLGPPRRNRKPVVQLLRPDGTTAGFAKVGWSPFTTELITNEALRLRQVAGRMPRGTSAPAVLVDQPFGDLHVVVTAPVHTPALSRRHAPLTFDTLHRLAELGNHRSVPVTELPMLVQLHLAGLDAVVDLERLFAPHADVPIELGLWHGDLTPWNTATSHGVTGIWDWEFADDDRPVGFDALHIAFELVRRSTVGAEASAIETIVARAPVILEPLNTNRCAIAAITDLYLCELLSRERRLAGEGWEPTHVGPLEQHLIDALDRRATERSGHPE